MIILHTEASLGWGGQEIRIFEESLSLREEGHRILLAAHPNAILFTRMQQEGFEVFPQGFKWRDVFSLAYIMRTQKVDIVNTHSSKDSWIGGIAARLSGCKILRTRHLSTAIRKGLNSIILYRLLADAVVTTCTETAVKIAAQSGQKHCVSIPTGIKKERLDKQSARPGLGIPEEAFVVGTLCVLRSWKGVQNLLSAAALLQDLPITWLIVGEGPMRPALEKQAASLKNVIFAGYIEPPYKALVAMDLFALLSTANEGVSQATLQAGALQKPLITTTIGGLPEVCLHTVTGFHTHSPEETAGYVKLLYSNPDLRKTLGKNCQDLVNKEFTFEKTVSGMKKMYEEVLRCKLFSSH